jgi:ectoine hydroxylase-related dioxygenase (phytanoyl-CoA dioxygenase family)
MILTPEETAFLEANGYLDLGVLLSAEEVKKINERLDELREQEGETAGAELMDSKYIRHPKEEGADRLADLVNKGEVFDIFYIHPRVLAGVGAVLSSGFKLSSLNYRAAKPGKGLQKLHVDFGNSVPKGEYKVCNSIWLLDDFTELNGPTRIVPGTHHSKNLPGELLEDPFAPHPDEIKITAPAGSVFIFNSHVWHGGTQNLTDRDRRSIHSYFCALDQPQQIDQQRYITEETKKRIGSEGMRILNVS